jgi:hypothetical protein
MENGMLNAIFFFFFFFLVGWDSTRYCGHFWPIVQAPDDR